MFENNSQYKYMGESSTGYFFFPNSIERIKENILDPKFIFILRKARVRVLAANDSIIPQSRRPLETYQT